MIRAKFSLALVLSLALAAALAAQDHSVPTPASVFGWEACSDYKLATYEQIAEYFRELDAASDRIRVFEIGKTAEGRTQLLSVISSEENLRNLSRHKEISRQLALARGLGEDEARALAREGRAIVWVDFGLHSSEVVHAQTAPEMAYRLVSGETEELREMRDQVIVVLMPNLNPDGTTKYAEWYMKHVGTPYEFSPIPELYHKYAGHDNNRDWFMFNLPESRNVAAQIYREFFPQILHNQHQTGPFPARIAVPPFSEPSNPNIPPQVMRGINLVGSAITRRLDREGKIGAVSRVQYDTWWNGGMRTAPYFHNMVGILTEAQHDSASPHVYDPKNFPKTFANGESTTEPSTFYPSPWGGGEWHMRNTCEYMMTASLAVIEMGAKLREQWLFDMYAMGRDAIRAGANETYVIPADQPDFPTAVKLVNVLRWGAIEVERATAPFTAGGRSYPAGSFLVRGAQPFRAHLTDLYPGGPPDAPYDITGWTLPFQMGVRVERIPEAVAAASDTVEMAGPPAAPAVAQAAWGWAIDPRANDAFIAANRLLKAGETVMRATEPVRVSGREFPHGAFLVASGRNTRARLDSEVRPLGIEAQALAARPSGELVRLTAPRIGVYQAWGGNMDEGWTRYVLEAFEFPYTTVRDRDIRAGNLRAQHDVIVLPEASFASMRSGLSAGTMPPEYTGGMTPSGVEQLHRFASDGGTIVALGGASELPLVAFGVPVRDVAANRPESEFYIPGTLLNVEVDATHPLAWGMPAQAKVFFDQSPVFAVGPPSGRPGRPQPVASTEGVKTVAHYPERDILASGWLLGESVLRNRAALVEAPVGKGRVVLVGFRSQHRGQSHGTYKILFNALYRATTESLKSATPTASR
jgi:hypothetical protein